MFTRSLGLGEDNECLADDTRLRNRALFYVVQKEAICFPGECYPQRDPKYEKEGLENPKVWERPLMLTDLGLS